MAPQVVDLLADLREFAQDKCEPPIYVSGAQSSRLAAASLRHLSLLCSGAL